MATYWENSCSFGLRYVSWYKYLIVSLVFSHLGFWSGNLFLIAPFPDLCLLVPFSQNRCLLNTAINIHCGAFVRTALARRFLRGPTVYALMYIKFSNENFNFQSYRQRISYCIGIYHSQLHPRRVDSAIVHHKQNVILNRNRRDI